MRRFFKVFSIFIAFCFIVSASSVFAFDINSYLEKYHVRKSLQGNTRWIAKKIERKDGTEYKVPAGRINAPNYCKTGSCTYNWSTEVPVFQGTQLVGYKTITGTATKTTKQGVGTVTISSDSEGKYKYVKVHLSDGFKQAIMNGDATALQKLNEITSPHGIYYKAEIKTARVRNLRTGEYEMKDIVRVKKVTKQEEAIIEDKRQQESGSTT